MNIKKIGIGAAALASAAAIGFAGTAQAATASEGTPTKDYQLCGTVYDDAAWQNNATLPAGANGVSGVTVTGTLWDSTGTFSSGVGSVTTGADGSYCIDGDLGMALAVQFSDAYVELKATPTSSVGSPNPWATAATGGTTKIDAAVFNAHMAPSFNSAWGFYFAAP